MAILADLTMLLGLGSVLDLNSNINVNPNINYNYNPNPNYRFVYNPNLNPNLHLNPDLRLHSNFNSNQHPNFNSNLNQYSKLGLSPNVNLSPNINPDPSLCLNPYRNENPNLNLDSNSNLKPGLSLGATLNTNPSLNLGSNINLASSLNQGQRANLNPESNLNPNLNVNPRLSQNLNSKLIPSSNFNPSLSLGPKVDILSSVNLNTESDINPTLNLNSNRNPRPNNNINPSYNNTESDFISKLRDAKIRDYPHQVSLRYNDEHICGGSIINDKEILTAAHCVANLAVGRLNVRVGSSVHFQGDSFGVESIKYHQNFNQMILDSDVAMLTLVDRLTFGDRVRPIDLVRQLPAEGTLAEITGWGLQNNNTNLLPDVLKVVTVRLINSDSCKAWYNYNVITRNMICLSYGKFEGRLCQSESGGPLVEKVTGKLIGVASWGASCPQSGVPTLYASVPELIYVLGPKKDKTVKK